MSSVVDIPTINVGICTLPELRFEFDGRFVSAQIPRVLIGECAARRSGSMIELVQDGAAIGSAHEIIIKAGYANDSFTVKDVTIGVQFHWQRNEDQRFVGNLKLVPSGNDIAAVNVVDIEEYLASVISSEMSASASADLLRAHAITSRSWLLAQLEKSRRVQRNTSAYVSHVETETERIRWYDREDHDLFDVCADDHCQRYHGITKAYSPSVKEAVSATCGQVLMHEGAVCDARFSKSCGGVSEAFENVWEQHRKPYLVAGADVESSSDVPDLSEEKKAEQWVRSRPAAFCNTTDKRILSHVLLGYDQETTDFFRWTVEYTQDELADIVRRRSGIGFGQIVDLIPVERGNSGRLIKLKIVGTKKTFIIGKELEIRRTLSNSHLYSSAFVIEKADVKNGIPSRFVIRGAGWGHGVGLCQIGAAVMGERGCRHERILSHYFPHTEIKKLY